MVRVLPNSNCPQVLKNIQSYWKRKSDAFGDAGSCVLGAGFEFVYKNRKYFMPPTSHWQGSISWEHCKDKNCEKRVIVAGAQTRTLEASYEADSHGVIP
jgi:hypothetical protein